MEHFGATIERGVEEADGHVVARFDVTDAVRQPFGIVHGGVYSAVAESACSIGTAVAVAADGRIAMGQSNQASFIRPASDGEVTCDARARHRGRSTWIWDCDFTDGAGRLLAVVRMTIAVRDAPG
ncbi:PaaI family thioesterase [Thermoleophilia bacterium SCSIO 60948]|nr:PaaI family thioesterase [Thermoleophilia bacterium SCSIO 60948]